MCVCVGILAVFGHTDRLLGVGPSGPHRLGLTSGASGAPLGLVLKLSSSSFLWGGLPAGPSTRTGRQESRLLWDHGISFSFLISLGFRASAMPWAPHLKLLLLSPFSDFLVSGLGHPLFLSSNPAFNS